MADSLFDNRYRYDYIYPRGRSGETLRAVDTDANERPVVIKRPAPHDAPPIRAGQEVSILNERKALKRLAGHPVLTDVLGEGQFFVGGQPHQYIVVERATGMIIADTVLSLSRSGERLPQLEMLVILDQLLDLLTAAHAKDVIYNDVDAKHLFWSREQYRLKVIDWGNAVFLEGDTVTPQGISRQTDIFQAGELLYFILSGGGRADVPRDVGADFRLDFGNDTERVPRTLQNVVSKALHPNLKHRYTSIDDLRRDLADQRRPLERERDNIISHVQDRLRRHLSKTELRSLLHTLEPAIQIDPGYPELRKIRVEVDDRLRDLEVESDLDAVKIYMTSGNWPKAADLLNELRDKAGTNTTDLVELLLDCTLLMLEADLAHPPEAVTTAAGLMFSRKMTTAAHTLLTMDTSDDNARKYQWLMAERISSRMTDILLLRPNLYRLALALDDLRHDGINVDEAQAMMEEIDGLLNDIGGQMNMDIAALRDAYRAVVDRLTLLNKRLSTLMVQERLPNRRLPLNALDRATNAAMALADNMHVIGKQATSSPRDALVALDASRAIDPTAPLWEQLSVWLNRLYELLQSYQTYVPAADGSDLTDWLLQAENSLQGYKDHLFDDMLGTMVTGLQDARENWQDYAQAAIVGNRGIALDALDSAAKGVSLVSPTLTAWLNQLRSVVTNSAYVQRHALFGGLGRALADGYEAFDRGRLPEAEQLGQRGVEIATDETQKEAARRLLQLAGIVREWIERGGVSDKIRTQAALTQLEALYTDEELRERERFAMQMPSRETYLKAMGKGLIEVYQRHSTPALRLFYFNAVLLGTLEAHEKNLEDGTFWREVAARTIGDYSVRHPATQALAEFIDRRRQINAAALALDSVCDKSALSTLNDVRRTLADNPEAKPLQDAAQSLRDFEAALRLWADGDFKGAGMKIESAMTLATAAEKAADISLARYGGWLRQLQATSAELHNLNRQMRQTVERRPPEPASVVEQAHSQSASATFVLLGEPYHAQLQNWNDTYTQFLSVYTDDTLRRSAKLERFNELFKAMFIDRHPAYDLYRHWYDIVESSPEFPAPPTNEPTPRISEDEEPEDAIYLGGRYDDDDAERPAPIPVRALPLRLIGFLLLIGLVGAGVVLVILPNILNDEQVPAIIAQVTDDASNTPDATETPVALIVLTDPVTSFEDESQTPEITSQAIPLITFGDGTPTLVPRNTEEPNITDSPTDTPQATDTPTVTLTSTPTVTRTPTVTPTPTNTPTPTVTPTPTLPPQGIQGTQELLTFLARLQDDFITWTDEQFVASSVPGGWRLGLAEAGSGDDLAIRIPAQALDAAYGNNAPSRIRRMEAEIAFTTYNPSIVDLTDVHFGLYLQSVNDPAIRVGLKVQVVNLSTVNLYLIDGDEEDFIVQRAVNAIDPRLRLERDANNGTVTIFYDDAQVGQPLPFIAPEAPVEPVVFVIEGGVLVNVNSWRVTLR